MTTWTEVFRAATREIADEHALVLEALGLPWGSASADGAYVLLVRVEDAERARLELAKYLGENRARPAAPAFAHELSWSVGAAAAYVVLLLACDVAARRGLFGLDWWGAGSASARLIRAGAWWRSVTALGLHADALHLAGNLTFGAAFGVMLGQSVGWGMAWFVFVATGGIGNALNAWLQAPSHTSIGASTAVFGILGAQVAHDWSRRKELQSNLFRRWAPLAIGAALLAWLGGDGRAIDPSSFPKPSFDFENGLPRIDVAAHVLGFGAGLVLGGLIGWKRLRFRPKPATQAVLAVLALGLFTLAWCLALVTHA